MKKGNQKNELRALPSIAKTMAALGKIRVATEVRLAHLEIAGRTDQATVEIHDRLVILEDFVNGIAAKLVESHPSYPWFSRVNGAGRENIAKIVGPINIEKAPTISSLWQFTGTGLDKDHHSLRKVPGQKLVYNNHLRSMCWRLVTSLLRAGLRHKCNNCDAVMGQTAIAKNEGKCTKCGSTEFTTIAQTEYAKYYLQQKDLYIKRFTSEGKKILPTPQGNWACRNCGESWTKKADATPCCDDQQLVKKNKEEPEGVIWLGHLDMMAKRKMLKLFLAHLWLTWREAEGLPTRNPYAIDKLGHTDVISPWKMVDKPAKKKKANRQKKT